MYKLYSSSDMANVSKAYLNQDGMLWHVCTYNIVVPTTG